MAIIKKNELKAMNPNQLKEKVLELKKEMLKLNGQRSTGTLENPGRIKLVKKTLARMYTMLQQKPHTPVENKSNQGGTNKK